MITVNLVAKLFSLATIIFVIAALQMYYSMVPSKKPFRIKFSMNYAKRWRLVTVKSTSQ